MIVLRKETMGLLKTIPEFPDYAITKDGRVWSKPRITRHGQPRKGRWLKNSLISYGYLVVGLYLNCRKYTSVIHRLVLETYVGPCPKDLECRHLNGNPADNRLENLCWGTHSENIKDSIRHGTHPGLRRGSFSLAAKLTETKVKVIRYLRDVAKFTLKEIAWQFDVSQSVIHSICKRKIWTHI